MVLTSRGRGETKLVEAGVTHPNSSFRWWIEGNDFIRRYETETGLGAIGNAAVAVYETIAGKGHLYRQRINAIEPNRIRLECPNVIIYDVPDLQILTRVRE